MKNILKELRPEKLFGFFEEISAIPRGSGNETAIADHIERFARERGHYCKRDSLNNVFVRKKASPGRQDSPSVLFQSHTDMVCVATPDKRIDFLSEPIELGTDGKFIFAYGTSLGADDGAGVAVMLALIDDDDIDAPETEYLFTSSEETGMDGANGFDYSEIHARHVINLDSSEEFNACIGCAGGFRADIVLPTQRVKTEGKLCRIEVGGLASGHSGTEIDKNRSSATKLLALALNRIYKGYPFHIADACGGTKENVIPQSAYAVVAFADNDEAKKAKQVLCSVKKELMSVLSKEDRKGFFIKFSALINTGEPSEDTVGEPERNEIIRRGMLSLKDSSTLISALMLSPQGVTDRYAGKDGAPSDVAGSVNLGVAKTDERETVLSYLIRSAEPFYADRTYEMIERLSHVCGGSVTARERYPGWESKEGESLQKSYEQSVRELYGRGVTFSRIHAGLECGIISGKLREQGIVPEMISIGPNCFGLHTTGEKMEIESFARLYEIIKQMLAGQASACTQMATRCYF